MRLKNPLTVFHHTNYLKDFSKINVSNIQEIIKIMETLINEVGCEALSMFINLKDISRLPCEQMGMGAKYFLGIAYIMNKQYNEAAKILEDLSFISDSLLLLYKMQ